MQVLYHLRGVCVCMRYLSTCALIQGIVPPQVKFLMSDETNLADLLALNLHKFEDEVSNWVVYSYTYMLDVIIVVGSVVYIYSCIEKL